MFPAFTWHRVSGLFIPLLLRISLKTSSLSMFMPFKTARRIKLAHDRVGAFVCRLNLLLEIIRKVLVAVTSHPFGMRLSRPEFGRSLRVILILLARGMTAWT